VIIQKKVLRLSINPRSTNSFLSCSADGTIRMFDIREHYKNSTSQTLSQSTAGHHEAYRSHDNDDYVLPQAIGGGRASRQAGTETDNPTAATADVHSFSYSNSLILDYRKNNKVASSSRRRIPSSVTLYSVDFHPYDGNTFIVGSVDGNVRHFDLRMITDYSPDSYTNIYRNLKITSHPNCEVTGSVFSRSGSEIVATSLNDYIYLYDTAKNFAKEYHVDYFDWPSREQNSHPAPHRSKSYDDITNIDQRKNKPSNSLIDPVVSNVNTFSQETLPSHVVIAGVASYLVDNNFLSSKKRRSQKSSQEGSPNSNKKQKQNNDKTSNNVDKENDDNINLMENGDNMTDEEEDNNSENDFADFDTYKHQYRGHYSCNTIKGVNFYGPNSEYIMSGSDDGNIYIWDKETEELVRILEGHENVVNCVIYHPFDPMIASSGIDHYVKIWQPTASFPTEDEFKQMHEHYDKICTDNQAYVHGEVASFNESVSSMCTQQ